MDERTVSTRTKCERSWKCQLHRHSHNGTNAPAVALPHPAEAGLATKIPKLDGHVTLVNFAHIEADGRNGVFCEFADLPVPPELQVKISAKSEAASAFDT